ncbi:hypothetical protein CJO36_10270 [Megasphaera elsdenii]|nr:hypothetical protein CJO36_10270 [Megasphaera elsdenii]
MYPRHYLARCRLLGYCPGIWRFSHLFRLPHHRLLPRLLRDPAKNIVQYSEEHPTDLIIIGNRGLSGLKKILLGSVSNYVLLRNQVPILIMK